MDANNKKSVRISARERQYQARPDALDFRDLMYTPSLVDVPVRRDLAAYRSARVPILDQGTEGACTGFGLATVAHYLLRTRKRVSDDQAVSPWMFYELARRYDEWPGENYDGSSCRGAMKGWHKHGVCGLDVWPDAEPRALGEEQANDAARRPLGAYYRVNHRDLVAMHAALTEVGILYASAEVHAGWDDVGKDGRIELDDEILGGHAFAIVGYDEKGFWLQNSWGRNWGRGGFGHVGYADWLAHGSDAWVARLAVPVRMAMRKSADGAAFGGTVRARAWSYNELRPHVVSLGNDGRLQRQGNVGTTPELVCEIVRRDIPRITAGWKKKRIVLYAHGGLVGEEAALQRVSDYRKAMLDAECYPLAFVWHSDAWRAVSDLVEDAVASRRAEGFLDAAKDFMLDRLDDAIEPLARRLGGRALWNEMKENALAATVNFDGGARLVFDELAALARMDDTIEIHLVGHSAGSIFLAPAVQYLATRGVIAGGPMHGQNGLGLANVASATLWAPAITTELFQAAWLPVLGDIGRFAVFTLDDGTERGDDCGGVYHKSLLYLVANAFESDAPGGEPLLGLQKCILADPVLHRLFANGKSAWIVAPNRESEGAPGASHATRHGDFDDDPPTVKATLARILGETHNDTELRFAPSAQRRRAVRRRLDGLRRVAVSN